MIEVKGKNFIAYNMGESVLQSIVKDAFTFLMLCFCLYISHWAGSVFWTFTSGLMFFAFMGIKMGGMLRGRQTKFKTWAEFKAWVDMQAEDEVDANARVVNMQSIYGNGNIQAGSSIADTKEKQ